MKARITHALNLNAGKAAKLDAVQAAYRDYVQACIDQMVTAKVHTVVTEERQAFFTKSAILTSQLQKCARAQASSILDTWTKALYTRLGRRIYETSGVEHLRSQLCMVGKCGLTQAKLTGKVLITQEALDIYWGWVWDAEIAGKTPVVAADLPMWLSEMCVEFGASKKAKHGGWWAKVSCLVNGRRVSIPLAKNPYLTDASNLGKEAGLARSVLIGKRHGRWTFQFTDKTPDDIERPVTARKIGVDVGLNVLAATSDGSTFGKHVKPKFDRLYRRVRNVRKNRMRQGLKENSPRLARLEQRLTGMVKTETGTVARKLVKAYKKISTSGDVAGRSVLPTDPSRSRCRA